MKLPSLVCTATTAQYVGVSVRHIWRVAEECGVAPVVMQHKRMKFRKADVVAMRHHREKAGR